MGRGVLLILACAGAASSQTGWRTPLRHALFDVAQSQAVVPVAWMQCQHPQYTPEARIAHLSGKVTVTLTVDDAGLPGDMHVVSPLGLGLDESALACMAQSRFSPAQKEGKPVPMKIDVSVSFEDRWDSDWHLGSSTLR